MTPVLQVDNLEKDSKTQPLDSKSPTASNKMSARHVIHDSNNIQIFQKLVFADEDQKNTATIETENHKTMAI